VTPGFDSLGQSFRAYTSWFRQQAGLPKDWRYGARAANVDVTNAGLAGPNALDIFLTMDEMLLLFPKLTHSTSGVTKIDDEEDDVTPRPVWYCNRTLRHWMDVQMLRNRNVLIGIKDYAGAPAWALGTSRSRCRPDRQYRNPRDLI